jgi:hypothetical protein
MIGEEYSFQKNVGIRHARPKTGIILTGKMR